MMVFVAFWILAAATLLPKEGRSQALSRSRGDWWVDMTGLIAQGIVVPALQATLVFALLNAVWPEARAALPMPFWGAFALNFIGIDYLYYWNHRLLHVPAAWPLHVVHHTTRSLDVLATSRNTLWTPLVIVYLWFNGFFVFLLADPSGFLLAAALTAALDLWRHTRFTPKGGTRLHRLLGSVLITPHEHGWHHSADVYNVNFGANLSLWDRLHGTYHSPDAYPDRLGADFPMSLSKRLLFPWHRASVAGASSGVGLAPKGLDLNVEKTS